MTPVTWEEAIALIDHLKQYDTPMKQRMLGVRSHYNADVLTPTYDVPGEDEPGRSPGPLLIADAIDTKSMRAASVMPSIGLQSGRTDISKKRMGKRRGGLQGVWHESGVEDAMLGRAFRHLFAYATVGTIAVEKEKFEHPIIELRDPLSTYSEVKAPEDFSPPAYVAYVYGKSEAWLKRNYPETKHNLFDKSNMNRQEIWDVVEYIDEDQIMIGVLGPRQPFYYNQSSDYTEWRRQHRDKSMMLRRWNNMAGRVPGYVGTRVTLDRIESSVMKLTGLVNEIGRLRTLEKIAAERGVFPDMVAFGDGDTPPTLVNGEWADGRDGEVNLLQNAKGFQMVRMDPSVVSRQITDQMEGAFGQSGGLDPLTYGEARGASLRTGAAIQSMASFSLDPIIMEAQKTMARVFSVTNEGVLALWKNGKNRAKKISMFTGRPGDQEETIITPGKDIEDVRNTVYYPLPGSDINSIQVALGQAMQTKMMSTKTARAANPLISNEEFEERQLLVEAMENAMVTGLLTQAQNPTQGATLVDLAEIADGFERHGDIGKAVREADALARERQANAAPAPEQQVGGLDPSNPGAMAQGDPAGAEVPFAGPTDRGSDLQRIMRNLNAGPTGGGIPAGAGAGISG